MMTMYVLLSQGEVSTKHHQMPSRQTCHDVMSPILSNPASVGPVDLLASQLTIDWEQGVLRLSNGIGMFQVP